MTPCDRVARIGGFRLACLLGVLLQAGCITQIEGWLFGSDSDTARSVEECLDLSDFKTPTDLEISKIPPSVFMPRPPWSDASISTLLCGATADECRVRSDRDRFTLTREGASRARVPGNSRQEDLDFAWRGLSSSAKTAEALVTSLGGLGVDPTMYQWPPMISTLAVDRGDPAHTVDRLVYLVGFQRHVGAVPVVGSKVVLAIGELDGSIVATQAAGIWPDLAPFEDHVLTTPDDDSEVRRKVTLEIERRYGRGAIRHFECKIPVVAVYGGTPDPQSHLVSLRLQAQATLMARELPGSVRESEKPRVIRVNLDPPPESTAHAGKTSGP